MEKSQDSDLSSMNTVPVLIRDIAMELQKLELLRYL